MAVDCCITDCGRVVMARGWCQKHYARWSRHGDPNQVSPKGGVGRKNGNWGDGEITYSGAHSRPRSLWGPAKGYSCVECGVPAKAWAYDNSDPEEKFEVRKTGRGDFTTLTPYSPWPEFYMPMCNFCHNRRDARRASIELAEYRQWKMQYRLLVQSGLHNGEVYVKCPNQITL